LRAGKHRGRWWWREPPPGGLRALSELRVSLGMPTRHRGSFASAQPARTTHARKEVLTGIARLTVMLAARDKLDRDAPKVFTAMGDAVGCIEERNKEGFVTRRTYAADLRKQRNAAEAAFRDA